MPLFTDILINSASEKPNIEEVGCNVMEGLKKKMKPNLGKLFECEYNYYNYKTSHEFKNIHKNQEIKSFKISKQSAHFLFELYFNESKLPLDNHLISKINIFISEEKNKSSEFPKVEYFDHKHCYQVAVHESEPNISKKLVCLIEVSKCVAKIDPIFESFIKDIFLSFEKKIDQEKQNGLHIKRSSRNLKKDARNLKTYNDLGSKAFFDRRFGSQASSSKRKFQADDDSIEGSGNSKRLK